jgi:hypothetical protein
MYNRHAFDQRHCGLARHFKTDPTETAHHAKGLVNPKVRAKKVTVFLKLFFKLFSNFFQTFYQTFYQTFFKLFSNFFSNLKMSIENEH